MRPGAVRPGAVRPGAARRASASRWMARIESASEIRPSKTIARASSKGTHRVCSSSVPSGDAAPASRSVATKKIASSSVTEFESAARPSSRHVLATNPVSSTSSRLAASSEDSFGPPPPSGISHE